METLQARYLKELKSYTKFIPTVTPKSKSILEPHTLSDNLLTGDVGNITFFICHLCFKRVMCFSQLRQHWKEKHQLKQVPYNESFVEEARYHRCHICEKQILCDNSFLSNHITRTHKLKMPQYINEYVLKSGNKAFPTYLDYHTNSFAFKNMRISPNITSDEEKSDNGLILPCMISSESEDSDEDALR